MLFAEELQCTRRAQFIVGFSGASIGQLERGCRGVLTGLAMAADGSWDDRTSLRRVVVGPYNFVDEEMHQPVEAVTVAMTQAP